jgi:sorbitol/mannitol transport system permease protein
MATQETQTAARVLLAPSVTMLFLWMIVPLAMIIYFSTLNFNLNDGYAASKFIGIQNFIDFLNDPKFLGALWTTIVLVGSVLLISVGGGIFVAMLLDQPVFGQGIVRLLVIAPFFVMPTVSALVWKHLLMNPESGFFAWLWQSVGLEPVVWLTTHPLLSVIMIVSWEWLPFASLILLTALQSLDEQQKEAAALDGATPIAFFGYILLPHLSRAITVVVLMETIFLLGVFAEILVTTNGTLGTTNIPFLVYNQAQNFFDVGSASAGGLVAVVLANIVSFFLTRLVGKNLEK